MRFSSIFQSLPTPRRAPPGERSHADAEERFARAPVAPPQPPSATPDLPDDLDARVRLIGEWQLGEG